LINLYVYSFRIEHEDYGEFIKFLIMILNVLLQGDMGELYLNSLPFGEIEVRLLIT
jgi:hypothetical protein